jgi:DNA polymerase-3 subunit gamma/tau
MSQALYRKWRPQSWEAVVGQDHVIQTLRNALVAGRIAHAYLFAGPRGTGKTTTARLLAKAVNCLEADLTRRPCGHCEHCEAVNAGHFLDLIEIDAASNTSVDDVRDLRDKINFSPNQARYKVYIIDEVHMLSTAAFNALLKTLEEPPSHAIFILATTEVHKIPATVLSRCQRHEFRRIPVPEIVAHLSKLAASEGIEVTQQALELIARQSTGAMRDAISLLDQIAASGEKVTVEMVHDLLGTATSQAVLDIVDALVARDPGRGLTHIHRALDAGSDPRQFARQMVDYLRSLLLIRMENGDQVDAPAELRAQMASHAQAFSIPDLLRIIRYFNEAANEARSAWQPALPLEMAFVASLQADEPPVEAAPRPAAAVSASAVKAPAREGQTASKPAPVQPDSADVVPGEAAGEAYGSDAVFKQIMQNWKKILRQVRQENPQTQGLLNSCTPIGMKDGMLFLGFTGELVKSKMEKEEHLEIARRAISTVANVEVSIRCVVSAGKRSALPPDVDSDGMVAAALRDLGGEIVDIQS